MIMDETDDLSSYNEDTVHNMWGDFDHYENIGTQDVFDEPDFDNFIDNLNDWD